MKRYLNRRAAKRLIRLLHSEATQEKTLDALLIEAFLFHAGGWDDFALWLLVQRKRYQHDEEQRAVYDTNKGEESSE